jgi:type II secretory pathway pseudopilin PulG
MRIFKKNEGFTLVELLAVIVVLVAIGSIIGAILFSSLRGSTKTNAISNVKHNGGFAISQMGKMIRDARSLESPRPCTVISPTPIPTVTQVIIKNFDGGQTTFICNDTTSGDATIASQSGSQSPISLLDTSTVALSSCYFTCTQNSLSDFPSISIFFSLQSNSGGSLVEQLAAPSSIPFETSVSLRNLR